MSFVDKLSELAASHFKNIPADTRPGTAFEQFKHRTTYGLLNELVGLAVPFARRNRFEIEVLASGYLRARIPLKGNRNHIGTLYAGAQFLLAEIPGGVMAIVEFGTGYFPVLKELTMTYLQPAKSDVTVEFRLSAEEVADILARAEADGKADFTLEGELKDKYGDVVARSHGLYQLRRKG